MGPNLPETGNLATFTEEILSGKLYFFEVNQFDANKITYFQIL